MIYDDLVAPVRPEGGLNGLSDGAAGIDIANNSSIFGVVAVVGWLAVQFLQ